MWKELNQESSGTKKKKLDETLPAPKPSSDSAATVISSAKAEEEEAKKNEQLAKEALEALKAMKTSKLRLFSIIETEKPVVQEKVRFAGEVFTYAKKATEKDLKKQEVLAISVFTNKL